MYTQVRKWGNCLALRIPKAFAREAGIEEDTAVEISLEDGKLVIRPASRPTLDELLAGVNQTNLHGETDMGPAAGGEVW